MEAPVRALFGLLLVFLLNVCGRCAHACGNAGADRGLHKGLAHVGNTGAQGAHVLAAVHSASSFLLGHQSGDWRFPLVGMWRVPPSS